MHSLNPDEIPDDDSGPCDSFCGATDYQGDSAYERIGRVLFLELERLTDCND
jgi:hypothetical protein